MKNITFTCPFCSLLCDDIQLEAKNNNLKSLNSKCPILINSLKRKINEQFSRINGKKTNSPSIELGDATIQSCEKQAVLKVNDDVFLIRPFSKIKIIANQLAEIVEGSLHGVFGKREKEY